jgi:cation diffusion facilitator CzcD-associated flavoprotein CzcO
MSMFFKRFQRGKKPEAATLPASPPLAKFPQKAVDEPRPIKVVVIGAGYSGIIAGIRLSQRIRNLSLTIYDSNADVGGTWYVNRYPGLACDIPSHAYQLSFEPNKNWSSYYAPGPEIREYLQGVAEKYNLLPYIQFQHRLVHAQYSETTGKWNLRLQRPRSSPGDSSDGSPNGNATSFEEIEDTADVLLTGIGALSRWDWPDISGLKDFKGRVIHSAQWDTGEGDPSLGWEDTVKTWKDKNVAVIGVGSSALQIVPSLQPKVKKLYNYARGKTWIGVPFVGNKLAELSPAAGSNGNYRFTDEEKAKFQDEEYYKKFRIELEEELNSVHKYTILNSKESLEGRELFKGIMQQKLAKKPWIAEHLIPDFAVACRRLTPAPGYLEALCEDNVDFISTGITKVTPTGIQTSDGNHQDLDIIVCATGFDTTYKLPFPLIGRNNLTLSQAYTPHPRTYMSLAVHGFPNWFQFLGPNSGVGAGSLLVLIEKQVDYAVEAVGKIQREWIKSMEPTKDAVDDFDEYLEAYFPRTVFGQKCKSWYKMGKEEGRIVAIWPGSSLHAVKTFSHPRWEDYNYTYHSLDDTQSSTVRKRPNRFTFLGNGETQNETLGNTDLAWYLRDVDVPPHLPEPQKKTVD